MQVLIDQKNIDVPARLADDVSARLDRLAGRYRFLEEARVVFVKQRNWYSTEITLHVKHHILRAEEQSDEIGTSADKALDKLEKQLRRHKDRLVDRRTGGAETRETAPVATLTAAPTDGEADEVAEDEEYELPRVVRVKQIQVKPMSVEEAALQMELLGHDFYVFTHDQSADINVLYRRRNGDIGLIQPERRA